MSASISPATHSSVVFFFDVDNTLLDNDSVTADLSTFIENKFGSESKAEYFAIFEKLRSELGYADYLGALQRYRVAHPCDVRLLELSAFLLDYPFPSRLYHGALDVIKRLGTVGTTAVLSDGDVVFQPRKIASAGILTAVERRVLIYIHKELMQEDIEERYPARHYVLIDDKPRILAAMKKLWGPRITTVQPMQGHYALDPKAKGLYPPADVIVDRIGDLLSVDLARLAPR